jgi:hypothetical protein
MFAYSAHDRKSPEFPELTGKRIVIIDDEAVISVDYWFQLLEIGARPQAVLPTNTGALSFLETHLVDAAILDYRCVMARASQSWRGYVITGHPL